MVKEVGIPHLTPHGLRHQYATAAREAGIEMDIISKNMGHTSVAIATDMRTHPRSSITKESANKLEIRSSGGQEQPVKEIKL